MAYLSFFRHVAGLDLPIYDKFQHYEAAAIHGGPRMMHARFWIVSDFPERIHIDPQRRPHRDDGPFCCWRDGWAIYRYHGVSVPPYVLERPELITIDRIDYEANDEVRRVMIERYGAERFVRDSGAVEVHADRYGTLYQREFSGGQPALFVRLVNTTPEADGSRRVFWRHLHPELRPLMEGGELGEPQEPTALNAVASLFGLRGEDYVVVQES